MTEREHTNHETGGAWAVTRWKVPGCAACDPDVASLVGEALGMVVSVGMDPDFGDLPSGITGRQVQAANLLSAALKMLRDGDQQ